VLWRACRVEYRYDTHLAETASAHMLNPSRCGNPQPRHRRCRNQPSFWLETHPVFSPHRPPDRRAMQPDCARPGCCSPPTFTFPLGSISVGLADPPLAHLAYHLARLLGRYPDLCPTSTMGRLDSSCIYHLDYSFRSRHLCYEEDAGLAKSTQEENSRER